MAALTMSDLTKSDLPFAASTTKRSRRPGLPALLIGCVIFADAIAGRMLLRADEERVYVLGRPIEWVCALRSRFGLPCPTCGVTRSIVMSLHGEAGRAWQIAPVGPVVLFGALAFAAAMLALAFSQWRGLSQWEIQSRGFIRRGALIYAAGAAVIWLGGWAVGFHDALSAH